MSDTPAREARRSQRVWFYGWIVVAIALVIVLPYAFPSGLALTIMNQMGIAIVFALSYNMLLGQGGMLSFGHAVFFGLGGFATIHALNAVGEDGFFFPVSLLPLFGAASGLFFGIIFGFLSTRRIGTSFAMITLGLGELVAASALMFIGFFGGEEGISGDRVTGDGLFGISFGPEIEVYYLIAAWMLVSVLLLYLLTQTPLGRMANAVRDNRERAAFVGYDPQRVRFLQFALAGLFGGVAGGLFALNYEILTFENLSLEASGSVLLMAFIGGIGHFAGPILGALVITVLEVMLSDYTHVWLLYLGLFFILMVMYAPTGLAGLIMMHQPLVQAGLLRRLAPAYLRAAGPVLALFVGGIILIELTYHLSSEVDFGSETVIFWVTADVLTAWPWLVGVALFAAGLIGLRWVTPYVSEAWGDALATLREGHGP